MSSSGAALPGRLSQSVLDLTYAPAKAPDPMFSAPASKPAAKLVAGTQAGHTWLDTGSVGGTTTLNDTSIFLVGTQSARRLSDGAGGASRLTITGAGAKDFTDAHASVLLRLENLDQVALLTIYAASGSLSSNNFKWDLKPDPQGQWYLADGRWTTTTLNFAEAVVTGAPNIAAITDWRVTATDLAGGPVAVNIGKVDTVPRGVRWPNGVWTLSMDDSFDTQLAVMRYAAQYGIRGTLYTIAELVGQGGYLTLANLRTAQDDLGFEIGAHAMTAAAHANRLTSLSPADLETELSDLKNWLLRGNFAAANHFCYPAGIFNGAVIDAVKRYFPGSARSTYARFNETTPPPERHLLRAKSLGSAKTLASAKADIDKAYASKGWAHHYGHIFSTTPSSITWTPSDIYALIDYANGKGIGIATVGEVLAAQYA